MIESVGPISNPTPPMRPMAVQGERSFKEILQESIDRVNRLQQDADQTLEKMGKSEGEVTLAFRKAELAFESLMQIRNRLANAFEEIQRMRV